MFWYNIFVRDTPYMETSLMLLGLACHLDWNKVLNPWIWLADHTHVTGQTFCPSKHGPEFYRAINVAANLKSCQNVCKHLYVIKNVQGIYSKVKVSGFRPEWAKPKIEFYTTRRSLQQNDMIFCKHDALLACFFFQIQTSNFRRKKTIN